MDQVASCLLAHLVMCCGAMQRASMSAPLAEIPSWKLPYVSIRPERFSGAVHDIPRPRLTDCKEIIVNCLHSLHKTCRAVR